MNYGPWELIVLPIPGMDVVDVRISRRVTGESITAGILNIALGRGYTEPMHNATITEEECDTVMDHLDRMRDLYEGNFS